MSIKIIQERIDSYHCTSIQEEEQALREVTQEIALAALSRSDFFKTAAFHGGTALRILYSLQRFSEDLDFMLFQPNHSFRWEVYFKNMSAEFEAYGFSIKVEDRSNSDETVKKAFIKENSIGKILMLKHPLRTGIPRQILVKFEIDTNPPEGSGFETKHLYFPFPFPVTVHDLPSLFSGKLCALLCREYLKGRDWFDFVWYAGRKLRPNFTLLTSALNQQGPWQGQHMSIDKTWLIHEIEKKIISINWDKVRQDVERFVKPRELQTLQLWNKKFMAECLQKIAQEW